jgi:hypothetical protein
VDFKQRKGSEWILSGYLLFALNSGFMILWGRALADNLCFFRLFRLFRARVRRTDKREDRKGARGMAEWV